MEPHHVTNPPAVSMATSGTVRITWQNTWQQRVHLSTVFATMCDLYVRGGINQAVMLLSYIHPTVISCWHRLSLTVNCTALSYSSLTLIPYCFTVMYSLTLKQNHQPWILHSTQPQSWPCLFIALKLQGKFLLGVDMFEGSQVIYRIGCLLWIAVEWVINATTIVILSHHVSATV